MTIRPGEAWGEVVGRPTDHVVARSDAELADAVVREAGDVLVTGGDLLAAVGGSSTGDTVRRYQIDLMAVTVDDAPPTIAVAHVVVRRSGPAGWWRGALLAVLNVGQIGAWDVAPRAHPNDGRLDVVAVDATMPVRARWHARRRLRTGTHVPHPHIHTSRPTTGTWSFAAPMAVWIDGVERGRTRSLTVSIQPDAAVVHA